MRQAKFPALVLLLVAACAKPPEVKEAPSGVGLRTELLDTGGEPREKLRYSRSVNLHEDLVIKLGLATLLESGSEAALLQSPVLALGLRVTTTSCDAGTCNYPFEFQVIGVELPETATEAQRNEITQAVAPLSGVKGTLVVDDRGITQDTKVDWPANASPRLITLLGNVRTSLITVPLPEEEVGVGARWKVERLNQVGAIKTTQTVTYNLLERKGRLLRIGVTLHQSAAPQTVAAGDTSFQLESYEVSGTGTMVMDLEGITPLSEIKATSQLRGAIVSGAETAPLEAAGALDLVVAPVASSAPSNN